MGLVRNLSIVNKLILMVAPPVAGVVFLSLGATMERYLEYQALTRVEGLSELAVAVSRAAYAIQRERGHAVEVLEGSSDAKDLTRLRAQTDLRLSELRGGARLAAGKDADLVQMRDHAFEELFELAALRQGVDGRRISSLQALNTYSNLVHHLFALVSRLPGYSPNAEVASLMAAYADVLDASEAAGVERAVIGGVIAARRIGGEQQGQLRELAVQQRLRLEGFFGHFPPTQRERLNGLLVGETAARWEAVRQTAVGLEVGRALSLPLAEWNAMADERLARLGSLAEDTDRQLKERVAALKRAAWAQLTLVAALTGGGLIVTFWLAFHITGRLSSNVRRLLRALSEFSHGNLHSRVHVAERDEMGRIGMAFNDMAAELQRVSEQMAERHAREKAEAAAFHRKVERIGETLRQVAFGDLTRQVDLEQDPELSQLGYHVNMMTNGLRELTRGMVQATDELAANVETLQRAAGSQAAAATEQSSATNETIATLQEIRTISAQSREKALALGRAADRALKEGAEGRRRVENSVRAMVTIREKVEAIGEHVQALREHTHRIGAANDAVAAVAQQSKMLALNAAIEAAKAGQVGKGFGIVAMEVGSLADQSAQATVQVGRILRDIRRAIDGVVDVVDEGGWEIVQALQSVEEAGDTVTRLGEVVQETATASKQIAVAVSQEAIGIDQLATAVEEINRATRQFADTSRRLEGTSNDIARISATLQGHAEVYEI